MSTEPMWLTQARLHLGVKEKAGKGSNPAVLAFFDLVGHEDIDDDDVAWCAAFTGAMLKLCNYPIPPAATNLMARSYLKYGKPISEPQMGAIAVFKRGTGWQGHVGFVVGWDDDRIELLGGNQGNKVSIASFPRDSLLGLRMPVAADAEDLRKAGSTEIELAETIKSGTVAVGTTAAAVKVTAETGIIDTVKDWTGGVDAGKGLLEGVSAIVQLISQNGLILLIGGAVVAYFLAKHIINKRVQRHAQGTPLSVAAG